MEGIPSWSRSRKVKQIKQEAGTSSAKAEPLCLTRKGESKASPPPKAPLLTSGLQGPRHPSVHQTWASLRGQLCRAHTWPLTACCQSAACLSLLHEQALSFSLMILAPSQGSAQKGPEQWDLIVLKCAQWEAWAALGGLMEFSCGYSPSATKGYPTAQPPFATAEGKYRKRERARPEAAPDMHARLSPGGKNRPTSSGGSKMASGLAPSPCLYNRRSKW